MQKKKSKNSTRADMSLYVLSTIGCILLFIIAGLFLYRFYRFQINPDGIAYINIARTYLEGHVQDAINGYWSPLFSWLLIPFLILNIPGLLAAKLLSLLIGAVALSLCGYTFYHQRYGIWMYSLYLLAVIPVVLWMSLAIISPDFLLAVMLTFYIVSISGPSFPVSSKRYLLSGILAGVAFLAKSFALPFFIVHFILIHVFQFFKIKKMKRDYLSRLSWAIVPFAIIVATWFLIVAQKYDHQRTTPLDYNMSLILEDKGHPVDYLGLVEPPHENATSIWDDPGYLQLEPRQPFESMNDMLKYAKTVESNIAHILLDIFPHFSPIGLALILLLLLIYFSTNKTHALIVLLGASFVYTIGYGLLIVTERYFWFLNLLMILIAGFVFSESNKKTKVPPLIYSSLAVIVLLSFSYPALRKLMANTHNNRQTYQTAKAINELCRLDDKKVASNRYWHESLFICYHLNADYYGTVRPGAETKEIIQKLKKCDIDYFLFWGRQSRLYDSLTVHFSPVKQNKVNNLKILKSKRVVSRIEK